MTKKDYSNIIKSYMFLKAFNLNIKTILNKCKNIIKYYKILKDLNIYIKNIEIKDNKRLATYVVSLNKENFTFLVEDELKIIEVEAREFNNNYNRAVELLKMYLGVIK